MEKKYIFNLSDRNIPETIGGKARNLQRLREKRFSVPETYICIWDAYQDYYQKGGEVLASVKTQLAEVIDEHKSYAVRSSANVEDDFEHSFAGQFVTHLNTKGLDQIIHAVLDVWKTTHSDLVQSYLIRKSNGKQDLCMAVIIQEMVTPKVSGVAFSRNPITYLDEIVVEAVQGMGTLLVQEGVTPYRWVKKWENWIHKPEQNEISLELISEVVSGTQQIAKAVNRDVDLEWVFDGEKLYWVQLRDITALNRQRIYSNKISKEQLPGLIKPLVWSINIPLVNSVWVSLLSEVIGKNDIDPESLARAFYYRAYYDMTTFGEIFERLGLPRQSLEIHMGIVDTHENQSKFKPNLKMISMLPRLLLFLLDKWRFSRKVEARFPELENELKSFDRRYPGEISPQKLLLEIDNLYRTVSDTAYFNIVVPLLMFTYNALLRRQLQNVGIEFEQINLNCNTELLQEFDPNYYLASLKQTFLQLDPDFQDKIRTAKFDEFSNLADIEGFQLSVNEFIERFGHLSDSGNDFSVAPWREDKDLILKLIVNYQPSDNSHLQKMDIDEISASGLKRIWLRNFYQRSNQFRYYRERVSSVYTYGYGLFRNYYLELGKYFVAEGLLLEPQDIFYLYDKEIRQIVNGKSVEDNYINLIERRKAEIERSRDIELPEIIYGDQPPPIVTAQAKTLHGTPTSRGVYHGPVKVVQGIRDFDKLEDGDVLVIPFSDVGWSPLFARAGAVISESGGILSHSSILAREYGIPAVVSVPGVLKLRDNINVTVDGFQGLIIIEEI